MFNMLLHPWDDILNIILAVALLLLGISYAWSQWKSGRTKSDKEILDGYETELKLLKDKVERLEKDNKEYQAQMNQLKGENTVLKSLLNNQDPEFRKIVTCMAEDIKLMKAHTLSRINKTNKRFDKIEQTADEDRK
jgi:chromosome segregation ATPase